jgi:hypothetical protein
MGLSGDNILGIGNGFKNNDNMKVTAYWVLPRSYLNLGCGVI